MQKTPFGLYFFQKKLEIAVSQEISRRNEMARLTGFGIFGAVLLAACGGGGGNTPIPAGSITVSGTVLNSAGKPFAGADVLLNGGKPLTSSADGTFSYTGVVVPYTLTVRSGGFVSEYRGLTRSNPQIAPVFVSSGFGKTVSGKVSGGTIPLPGDDNIVLAATGNTIAFLNLDRSTGAYQGPLGWWGSPTLTTDLVALQYSVDRSVTPNVFRLGKRTGVSLTSGGTLADQDITLNPLLTISETTLNFNSGAYAVGARKYYWTYKAGGATFLINGKISLVNGVSTIYPSEGASLGAEGNDAEGGFAQVIVPAVAESKPGGFRTTLINLPTSAVLQNAVPDNGATGVSKTPSLSRASVAGTTLYLLRLIGAGNTYTFYLPGDSSTLAFPDYSSLGLPLTGSTVYSWYVESYQTAGYTPDGITDPGTLNRFRYYTASSLSYFKSATSTFTTAP
jgi:hypothetical protein